MTMPRPTTKTELLNAGAENYEKLNKMIGEMTKKELETSFDFSNSLSKKEAHWKRDKNLRDVLVHLYEWHQLLLNWVDANHLNRQEGKPDENKADESGAPVKITARGKKDNAFAPLLPPPYNWKNYGEMNMELWRKHQDTSLEDAKAMLQKSHEETMRLAESFSNEELFSRDAFPWTGGNALGSYFAANMSSHYDWAMKKLKAHKKNCQL